MWMRLQHTTRAQGSYTVEDHDLAGLGNPKDVPIRAMRLEWLVHVSENYEYCPGRRPRVAYPATHPPSRHKLCLAAGPSCLTQQGSNERLNDSIASTWQSWNHSDNFWLCCALSTQFIQKKKTKKTWMRRGWRATICLRVTENSTNCSEAKNSSFWNGPISGKQFQSK